jgi:hypothetical protein
MYPWKLQEKFPELRFVNLGTAGYGSYQSLHPHPNGVMNTHWAACIAAALRKRRLPESAERMTDP